MVLPPLVAGSLTVAPAAVAVHGAGCRWAGVLSGSLPLGCPAAVARRRVEEVEDADSYFHVGAFVTVHWVRPPAGEEAVRQVSNAAPVFS